MSGTQNDVEADRGVKWRDHRECGEPPKEASQISEAPRTVMCGLYSPTLWSRESVSLTEDPHMQKQD